MRKLLRALQSPYTFSSPGWALFYGAQLGLWLMAVILMSMRHEPWLDEVRALTIAIEPHWWWQLPQALKNEGHPILWYLLLRFAHDVFHSPVVLKGVSVGVGFLSVALFLWRAPFPGWLKTCFVWSFLPLYEYSVIARNYGISMLLLFAFAAVFPLRQKQPYVLALFLALLANTNVPSFPLALGLGAYWIWEECREHRGRDLAGRLRVLAIPVSLVVLCLLGAFLTCLPQAGYSPPGLHPLSASAFARAFVTSVLHPGLGFPHLLPFPLIIRSACVLAILLGLATRPMLMVIFAFYPLGLQSLFAALYPGGLRQEGLFLVAALACYWIAREAPPLPFRRRGFERWAAGLERLGLFGVILPVLLVHVWLSVGPIRLDWNRPFSSNKAFSALLHGDPTLRNAILVPEPASLMESMPYYSDNRIFFARIGGFGRRVPYVPAYRQNLNLGNLLAWARELRSRYEAPVLIVMGYQGWQSREQAVIYEGPRTFTWTADQRRDFLESTRLISSFRGAITDENYDVYLLLR